MHGATLFTTVTSSAVVTIIDVVRVRRLGTQDRTKEVEYGEGSEGHDKH